ncbi:nucleolar protein 8 isoform X2 [Oryzias latipes]|uniref:nucleolar protein 8 isoform X2 n=1 Tax=Oryzias latipes TaxID=8090 RepID=UPI0009D965EF|nr:nucleolar protein 8 isoform X2 [Oryzias latipes]
MRRLFVGGLSHTVTQKELKDRFGKFGDVVDVELRTRRDEEGVPYKTFGYINISISDADLKRCLTVLNKSKWKGGTLQIETAKESFLHRLAQEQQAVANQDLQQAAADDRRQNLLDSLSKAGIDNFTMKAAVPGTEVPGHKDWVVSKFGRVLPVLQLRCQKGNKARVMKYDPSKYSHNIRKLDRCADDQSTPVSQLTWELDGGDDDISRKRRGEFPSYKPRRAKKSRPHGINICKALDRKRLEQNNSSEDDMESKQFSVGPTRTKAQLSPDSDVDSDEDICRLMAAQDSSHNALHQEAGESQLEVVGLEYSVKSGRKDCEDEYDSADTDELFASRRNVSTLINNANEKAKRRSGPLEKEEKVKAPLPLQTFSFKEDFDLGEKRNKSRVLPVLQSSSVSHSDDEEEEEEESEGSCSDSEYEAMFSHGTCLEMSFADLQKLAEDASQSSETACDRGSEENPELAPGPEEWPALKKGISPEEILAAILEESTSDEDGQNERKKPEGVSLPAFQGTKSLKEMDNTLTKEKDGRGMEVKKQMQISEAPQMNTRTSGTERQEGEKKALLQVGKRTLHKVLTASESSSSSDEEEKEEERTTGRQANVAEKLSAEIFSEEDRGKIFPDEGSVEAVPPPFHRKLNAGKEEELQRKANLRRLSALQQKQKEAEEQKRLIQGALANLDAPPPKAGKRVVFDSDDENNEDEEEKKSWAASSKKKLQDIQSEEEAVWSRAVANQRATKDKFTGPQLFDSSEEEDSAEEEDNGFHIRPQFEGQAGQKLMALQHRFGTDERFRMDERFLEEEEEMEANGSLTVEDEALEEEKKNNLSILQNVLGSSKQPSSKTLLKAAKFRDVSTLHYDPSKEEHSAFETKTIKSTESKSARRKKREEAQKLPEVSPEIFYQVSSDLKGVFGQTKEDLSNPEKTNWDQVKEEEDRGKAEELQSSLLSEDPTTTKEGSSGFKFSFFGVDAEASGRETTEYKVESIQAPKVSWQQNQCVHDSSSDEEQERQSTASTETEETPIKSMDLFFFYPGDTRLKGPTLFCRSSQLEEQREEWEERRTTLRREVRKKHKDAQRKLKAAPKS